MLHTLLLLSALVPSAPAHDCWVRGNRDRLPNRPSPLDSASVAFAGGTITVCYGRPSARGRTMMGGVEPFGRPSRLGANEATSISFPVDVRFGDAAVPAGTYTLYAIPNADRWELFVNGIVERWGIPLSEEVRNRDVGSTAVPVETSDTHVEMLTMAFESRADAGVDLVITWETARVRVPIRAQ